MHLLWCEEFDGDTFDERLFVIFVENGNSDEDDGVSARVVLYVLVKFGAFLTGLRFA
jgi:hypothetical protein